MKPEFFEKNRKKLCDQLLDQSIMILFSGKAPRKSADEYYDFTPNKNFYYLTGITEANVIYAMKKVNNMVSELLFIKEPNPLKEKWEGKTISKEQAKYLSSVDQVVYLNDFHSFLSNELRSNHYETLYLDLEAHSFEEAESPSHKIAKDIQKFYPNLKIENLYHEICEMRVIKTEVEINKIKEAIEVTDKGIRNMLENAESYLWEYQLEAFFDFALKQNGNSNKAYKSIVASGKNATILHYKDNNCQTKDGDLILLDLGAERGLYKADISFTFPVNGKFTERQKQIYNIVLKTLYAVEEIIKPGLEFSRLNSVAKEILIKGCKEIGLIKEDHQIKNYFYHGVSHFLGLDTHDVGSYHNRILQPGMVITVEPGLYIDEEGIGIRIEDNILVTDTGYENLSKNIIRTVDEIEQYMENHPIVV